MTGLDSINSNKRRTVVAEWLRRLIRNQLSLSRVGSSPTDRGNALLEVVEATRYQLE